MKRIVFSLLAALSAITAFGQGIPYILNKGGRGTNTTFRGSNYVDAIVSTNVATTNLSAFQINMVGTGAARITSTGAFSVVAPSLSSSNIWDSGNPLFWGATGNGEDASDYIQAALTNGVETRITRGAAGLYTVDKVLLLPSGHTLRVDPGVVLRAKTGLNTNMLQNSDLSAGNTNIVIIGGVWDGNGPNQTVPGGQYSAGDVFHFSNVVNCALERLTTTNAAHGGIAIYSGTNNVVRDVVSFGNHDTGLYSQGGDTLSVFGGDFSGNQTDSGIDITTTPRSIVSGAKARLNYASGISINARNCSVVGNVAELNTNQPGLNIGHNAAPSLADGTTVSGNVTISNNYGIQIQTGTTGVEVRGNLSASNSLGNYAYSDWTTNLDPETNRFGGSVFVNHALVAESVGASLASASNLPSASVMGGLPPLYETSFPGAALPSGWVSNGQTWTVANGLLTCSSNYHTWNNYAVWDRHTTLDDAEVGATFTLTTPYDARVSVVRRDKTLGLVGIQASVGITYGAGGALTFLGGWDGASTISVLTQLVLGAEWAFTTNNPYTLVHWKTDASHHRVTLTDNVNQRQAVITWVGGMANALDQPGVAVFDNTASFSHLYFDTHSPRRPRLEILGDSYTEGDRLASLSNDDRNGRWCALLRTFMGEQVTIAGMGGESTTTVLSRLSTDLDLFWPQYEMVYLQNDNDLPTFAANMTNILTRIQARQATPVLATLGPWTNQTKNAYFLLANAWIRTNAAALGYRVVDFARALSTNAYQTNMNAAYDSGDGVHPNAAGNAALFSQFLADAPDIPVQHIGLNQYPDASQSSPPVWFSNRVGVLQTRPNANLEVGGGGLGGDFRVSRTANTNFYFEMDAPAGAVPKGRFLVNGVFGVGMDGNGSLSVGQNYQHPDYTPPPSSLIVESAIGIGLTNPAAPLDILSRSTNALDISGVDGTGYGMIGAWNTPHTALLYSLSRQGTDLGIGAYGGIGLQGGQTTTAPTNFALYISSGGNVGVGTNSPQTALHVNGTATASAFVGTVGASNVAGVIPIGTVATNTPAAGMTLLYDGSGNRYWAYTFSSNMVFSGSNTFGGGMMMWGDGNHTNGVYVGPVGEILSNATGSLVLSGGRLAADTNGTNWMGFDATGPYWTNSNGNLLRFNVATGTFSFTNAVTGGSNTVVRSALEVGGGTAATGIFMTNVSGGARVGIGKAPTSALDVTGNGAFSGHISMGTGQYISLSDLTSLYGPVAGWMHLADFATATRFSGITFGPGEQSGNRSLSTNWPSITVESTRTNLLGSPVLGIRAGTNQLEFAGLRAGEIMSSNYWTGNQVILTNGNVTASVTVTATNGFFTTAPTNGVAPPSLVYQPIGLFGFMGMSGSTNTVTVGSSGTYYVVTNFNSFRTNNFVVSTGASAGGYLTNLYAGFYRISYYLSCVSGNSDTLEVEVNVNGTGKEEISGFATYDNPARMRVISGGGILYLPANSYVSLQVNNRSSASNVTIWRGGLTIGTP